MFCAVATFLFCFRFCSHSDFSLFQLLLCYRCLDCPLCTLSWWWWVWWCGVWAVYCWWSSWWWRSGQGKVSEIHHNFASIYQHILIIDLCVMIRLLVGGVLMLTSAVLWVAVAVYVGLQGDPPPTWVKLLRFIL